MADIKENGEVGQALRADSGEEAELKQAREELSLWKNKVKEAEDTKAQLTLQKLDEEDEKTKAQEEMMSCSKELEDMKSEFTEKMKELQSQIEQLNKHKLNLMDKLRKHRDRLQQRKDQCDGLRQKFKISANLLGSNVEFIAPSGEQEEDESQPIRGEFVIIQRPSVPLTGGQAIITFEEEKVASQILKVGHCSVSCDDQTVDVKPKKIILNPAVKFELQLQISRKEVNAADVPLRSLAQETMEDKLWISFSRVSRGGGEVELVKYDKQTSKAAVSFLQAGVVGRLLLKGSFPIQLDQEVKVQLQPAYKYRLRKFQTFCGVVLRSVLLEGIEDVVEKEELKDHLEIHFQKPKNFGGEIENIEYVSCQEKPLQAFFISDEEEEQQ